MATTYAPETTEKESISPRVERGAAWLDENRPGWRDAIDLRRLRLSSTHNCVLGQVFGGFGRAWGEQGASDHQYLVWAAEHGFFEPRGRPYYDDLQRDWERVIHRD